MKIRQGFVSNSSSSSFVVALPKSLEAIPESVQQYLFGDDKVISAYDNSISTKDAAIAICEAMQSQEPNDLIRISAALNGYLEGSPDYEEFRIKDKSKGTEDWDVDWDAYSAACRDFNQKYLADFLRKAGAGMNIYAFTFSDNDGSFGATMEHGEVFGKTQHIHISQH